MHIVAISQALQLLLLTDVMLVKWPQKLTITINGKLIMFTTFNKDCTAMRITYKRKAELVCMSVSLFICHVDVWKDVLSVCFQTIFAPGTLNQNYLFEVPGVLTNVFYYMDN